MFWIPVGIIWSGLKKEYFWVYGDTLPIIFIFADDNDYDGGGVEEDSHDVDISQRDRGGSCLSQEGSQSTTDEDYESDFSDGSTEVVLFWFISCLF